MKKKQHTLKLNNSSITLRALEPDDLDIVYRWENDPSLWPCGDTCAPLSRHRLKEYIDNYDGDINSARQLRLMIVDNASGRPAGTIDITDYDPVNRRASVGVFVDEEFRHMGYATTALMMVADLCHERLGMHQLWAIVAADNTDSRRLFSDTGFKIAGHLQSWLRQGRRYSDAYIYQKLLTSNESFDVF